MGNRCTALPPSDEPINTQKPPQQRNRKSKSKSKKNRRHQVQHVQRHSARTTDKEEVDLYEQVLSSSGRLEIPEKFRRWFPERHGHRKVRRLFTFLGELGHGVTGSVYKIEYKSQICAMKQIEKNDQWGTLLFTTEARVLSKLKHNGIIQFIDMFFDDKYYYLVLEKADYDLYYVMQQKGRLSERKTKHITYALLKAIAYMHKKNLCHRDLKPENIVFVANETNKPRLIDFGDAEMARKEKIYTEFVGTPPYMSPERLEEHKGWQLKKADIWAIAVIAYEMYCGKRCFEGDTQKQVFGKILRGDWSWPDNRKPSAAMQEFISSCLQHDAKDRPTAKEALNHSWFESKRNEENKEIIPVTEEGKTTQTEPINDLPKLTLDHTTAELSLSKSNENIAGGEEDDGIIKVKHVTRSTKQDGLTKIFESLASRVSSNRLQDILVKGYAQNLQDADLDPFKDEFDRLDYDKDGFISGIDLIKSFTAEGIGPNQASSLASIILSQLDVKRTGRITFKEFLEARLISELSQNPMTAFTMLSNSALHNGSNASLHSSGYLGTTTINQIHNDFETSVEISTKSHTKIFNYSSAQSSDSEYGANHDENEFITPAHIVSFGNRSKSSLRVSQEDLKEIFKAFDRDGDGRLSFQDFVDAVTATRLVDAPVVDNKLHQLPRHKRCHSKHDLFLKNSKARNSKRGNIDDIDNDNRANTHFSSL